MRYKQLGTTDLRVSGICFGTLWIGGIEENDALASLNRAFDLGVNFFDSADGYLGGLAEKYLGTMAKGRRDKVIIATKGGLDNGQFGDSVPKSTDQHVNMAGERSATTFRNSKPGYLRAAIDASLKRLGTDYIDLYQIHYPDSTTPFAETIGALETAQREGKIRYFGVSNFTTKQLQRWMAAGPLHSVQPCYNLFRREIEVDLLPFCLSREVAVINYSTLAHGLLTDKFRPGVRIPASDFRSHLALFAQPGLDRRIAVVDKLAEFAKTKGLTCGQLSIAWVLAHGVTSALVAEKKPNQVDENVRATAVVLSKGDLVRIEGIFRESPITRGAQCRVEDAATGSDGGRTTNEEHSTS
jgi:aryl-alcohol dehydrogenase-like predicted oxidoreductase